MPISTNTIRNVHLCGIHTINLYTYYGLNSLFKSQVNGEPVNVKAWNIFYIYFITKEQVKATGTTPNKKYEFSIGMGFLNGRKPQQSGGRRLNKSIWI
jgi:hypothetical protein